MKRLTVLLLSVVLLSVIAGTARADSVFLQGVTNNADPAVGHWSDAYQGAGTNYCWLATASNMLAYSNWNAGLTSATDIFNYSSNLWNNLEGNPYYAVEWWFDGQNSHPAGTWPEPTGGGNFYTKSLFDANFRAVENNAGLEYSYLNEWIKYHVDHRRVYTLLLGTSSGGIHFVTGWGYEIVGGNLAGIYFTDSFTSLTELRYSPLNCSTGDCYLDVYTSDYIISMERIEYNINNVQPNYIPGGENPVPEPTTMLLLASGLAGILVASARRK